MTVETVTVTSEAFRAATWLLGGLIGLLCVIAWWGFRAMIRRQDTFEVKLDEVSGRQIGSEEWQKAHDRQDDERHTVMTQNQRDLWQRVNLPR